MNTAQPTLEDVWRLFRETDRRFQETDHKFQETDRQLKELGKQIGGLGKKFGSFTEGMALPSMEKILRRRFGMEVISPSVRLSKGDRHVEIDVLAYANGKINQAFVVEVKSHPRLEDIRQIKNLLKRFRDYFPEHKDKTLYGMLAAVDISSEMRERWHGPVVREWCPGTVPSLSLIRPSGPPSPRGRRDNEAASGRRFLDRALREGLYVARIHDSVFEMDTPVGFEPKAF